MAQFTHLHVHSHYSLLDGLPKINELIEAAKKQGASALALTDHGTMYGAIEFYIAAEKAGLKPIIGVEAYVAPNSLEDKSGKGEKKYNHLILLAKNYQGYKNLISLVTTASLKGYYYKPRIDKNILKKHSEGLIALSGCLGGEIAGNIANGKHDKALLATEQYREIFEKDSFYLEIQRNTDDEIQKNVNKEIVKISKQTGIPLVATADVHYLSDDDKMAQDILVCVGTGKTVDDTNRLDMRNSNLHLSSAEEMTAKFNDLPEALSNTQKITDMIDLEIPLYERHFPDYPIPEETNAAEYLKKLCYKGLGTRYEIEVSSPSEDIKNKLPEEISKRLEYEMDIINTKGYPTYFLVVADFVNWSRTRGIISTTRGSAAGSLVAYALGITTINPVEYKLPFERFLNPYRPSPPDIDIDIADNRRDEVLSYVSEKYGRDKVAQIVTFGTMMARAAIRDVGRALGIPYSKCDKVAKMIPFGKQGFQMTIEKAINLSPDLKNAYDSDPETKNLIELSKKVEGCARHASIHAAGVVISPTKLTDFVPLQMDTDNKNIITQYEMNSCEAAGLVKMDFLGIRNLSILGNAIEIVRATRGVDIDLQNIPLDDQKTFDLLSQGKTLGVFQLGGSGMTKHLIDLRPTNIFDIMAMISLYRPGPMESIPEFIKRKHNPNEITYLDPRLQEILDMSYGVITYQDDVLMIAIKLANYDWVEADKLRKAMGKKIPKEMAAQKEKFIQGAIDNDLSSEKAVKLWKLIEPFAAYGFGKSHAASYAMVAYQTAYMKTNYPVEFMASVMTAESHNNEKIAAAVAESNRLGIEVLPPDINQSLANFTVIDENNIRFGFSAIKNLGSDIIKEIIRERKESGQFQSVADFVQRVQTRNFNKKSWEALVKSGCLDQFGERNQMLENTDIVLEYARARQKQKAAGQESLFAENDSFAAEELVLKPSDPANEADKLSWEKELLGLYVSSHPLKNHRNSLEKYSTPVSEIDQSQDGQQKTIGGIITRIQKILTKKGDEMCFADLEDETGSIELVIFPNTYQEYKTLIETDRIVLIRGKINDRDGEVKILVDKLIAIDDPDLDNKISQNKSTQNFSAPSYKNRSSATTASENNSQKSNNTTPPLKVLKIKIPKNASPDVFQKMKKIFDENPGDTQVTLVIPDRENTPREVRTEFSISCDLETKNQIKQLLATNVTKKTL